MHRQNDCFTVMCVCFSPAAFLSPMFNCLVHMVMYAYYGLSVFPSLRKYLWWKKYLTMLQLVSSQFIHSL